MTKEKKMTYWSLGTDLFGIASVIAVVGIIYMKVRKISLGEMLAELRNAFTPLVEK
jgi:hypothetical protein